MSEFEQTKCPEKNYFDILYEPMSKDGDTYSLAADVIKFIRLMKFAFNARSTKSLSLAQRFGGLDKSCVQILVGTSKDNPRLEKVLLCATKPDFCAKTGYKRDASEPNRGYEDDPNLKRELEKQIGHLEYRVGLCTSKFDDEKLTAEDFTWDADKEPHSVMFLVVVAMARSKPWKQFRLMVLEQLKKLDSTLTLALRLEFEKKRIDQLKSKAAQFMKKQNSFSSLDELSESAKKIEASILRFMEGPYSPRQNSTLSKKDEVVIPLWLFASQFEQKVNDKPDEIRQTLALGVLLSQKCGSSEYTHKFVECE